MSMVIVKKGAKVTELTENEEYLLEINLIVEPVEYQNQNMIFTVPKFKGKRFMLHSYQDIEFLSDEDGEKVIPKGEVAVR